MKYQIVFSPEAREQLAGLFQYLAAVSTPDIATGYTDAIMDYCESLTRFPICGVSRDDVRPGLRVAHYKKRTAIAFTVDKSIVAIIGIFYGGQDYETLLSD